ncbi:sugar transferase [Methylobacterium tarhaniae]|uniref:sugar transferase n=1 Tax=Methylobacterium tarhaniae TaxID=1187852 RepID=UPI003D02E260
MTAYKGNNYDLENNITHEISKETAYIADRIIRSIGIEPAIAVGAVVLLSPLLLLIAIIICLETKGSPIFTQARTGLNGKIFRIYKFRTMTVQEDGKNVVQAVKYDKRITRFGKILRKTSLDELPQLINIIKSEMSIVGPRPHATAHDLYYCNVIKNYNNRFAVKPGMTGWAQINGCRGETEHIDQMDRRVALDLWYIENKSVFLDAYIIMITVMKEFITSKRAY